MTQIKTKLHTVFMLVGPSQSGKSTFAEVLKQRLISQGRLAGSEYRVSILSSDAIRCQLLQEPSSNKMEPRFLEASEQAFNLLYKQLDILTTFPINHEFIIVDTTGMDPRFRKEIKERVEGREYRVELVLFAYNEREVKQGVPESFYPTVMKHMLRMKKDVLPSIRSKDYNGITRITKKSRARWEDVQVEVVNARSYADCFFTMKPERPLYVIGDVHEHVQGLQELMAQFDRGDYAFIGDYLDKGGNTEEILRMIYKLAQNGAKVVVGNHEAYVYRALTDEQFHGDALIEEKYITSLATLRGNTELTQMFIELFEQYTVPFLHVSGPGMRTMYLTHAPCEEKYLGKLSPFAQKAQRNLYVKDRENYTDSYKFIFEEAVGNKPIHVFGHLAHCADMRDATFKNKVFLDTGAVYGGKLTALVYKDNNYFFMQQECQRLDKTDHVLSEDLVKVPESMREFNIDNYDLTPKELKFVSRFPKTGVKFISGTMAPAAAKKDGNDNWELESLEAGLQYYLDKGVKQVVLEPKYMGSRCQFYLFNDERESFAVSRGGYIIRPERVDGGDLVALMAAEKLKLQPLLNFNSIILDGELMPWSALGKDLIEDQFEAYQGVINNELGVLDNYLEVLAKLEYAEKPNLADMHADTNAFTESLSHYAMKPGEVPLEYKPFSILALNDKPFDASVSEVDIFNLLNNDDCCIVDFEKANWSDNLDVAWKFFYELTIDKHMEGVVIKPMYRTEGVVPAIKVRNEEYLRLIYGADYKRRYAEHASRKEVRGKMSVSLKEWQLGQEMLVAESEEVLKEKVVKMLGQIKREQGLDPRL